MKYLLALDIGTTSVKAGLFNERCNLVDSSIGEYLLLTPAPDRAELDPEIYWQAAVKAIKTVIHRVGIDTEHILGLTISSQGETLIILDENDTPLMNAIVWVDNRATKQAAELNEQFSNDVYQVTGIPEIVPTWPACKILWLQQESPEIFNRAKKYLLVQDYLVWRFTGSFTTDGSISCTTMYYDINRQEWWKHCLETIGITADHLPQIKLAGETAGLISKEVSEITGLSVSTRVILGGMDQAVGAIGAGNVAEGIISETTGAALAIQACVQDPDVDSHKVTPVYVHSVPGKYLLVPVCPTAGMALKWFKDSFFTDLSQKASKNGTSIYKVMDEMAAAIPAGADGLTMLPHLMGAFSPFPNAAARGSFTGFTLAHGREHFIRAIIEAVAFLLRQNIESIENAGFTVGEIRTSGGGSHSSLWNQIKADVTNRPILRLETEDSALLGDAILAAVACGFFDSIEDACHNTVTIKERILPGPDAEVYDEMYRRYCDLDKTLGDYFQRNY
jgi:xylulokinase